MTSARFHGIIPPLLTPRTDDGQVDVESLRRLTRHLIDAGMHGLFVLGSTGEVAYLTDHQRELVVRTVVAETAGQVPVLAGVIDLTPERVAAQARAVVAAGADAVVATAPLYTMNDGAEIAEHFRFIAAAVDVPVFAYDIPVRAHVKLDPVMLIQLGTEGVIAGVKDSSGDDVGFRRLVAANAAAGSPLVLFTGHETVVDGMLLGADVAGVGAFKVALAAQGLIGTATPAFPLQALEGEVAERITEIVRAAGLLPSLAQA